MKFIKKNWFIIAIIIICILRFLLSFNLSSFYLENLRFDDKLMIIQLKSLTNGKYLGHYNDITLIKGIAYPMCLFLSNTLKLSYSAFFTILYIAACLYFSFTLGKIIKNKYLLLAICFFLLFNPISYSSELLQRLYRNSLSIIEMLFFLGTIISIICSSKRNVFKYVILGIITGIMFLTREDNIWTIIILTILFIYKIYKEKSIKTVLTCTVPIITTIILLNVVSYINYREYKAYTYNELKNTAFKDAFIKILQIKDEEKIDRTAILKSTLIKLAKNSKILGISEEEMRETLSRYYSTEGSKEIRNGNIVWYVRNLLYKRNNITDGEKANKYFIELSNEIEELFQEGKLEREYAIPSIFIYLPTANELEKLPMDLLKAITYTSSYENVKTYSNIEIAEKLKYNESVNAYEAVYLDYHNAENLFENNITGIEIIRNIYKYFTIIFSFVSIIIYIKNIKIKDKLNLVLHIILIMYLIIICGVTYTHTTAFDAIRYCYLGSIYLLQNMFILLNIARVYDKKREKFSILLESILRKTKHTKKL